MLAINIALKKNHFKKTKKKNNPTTTTTKFSCMGYFLVNFLKVLNPKNDLHSPIMYRFFFFVAKHEKFIFKRKTQQQ